MKADQAFSAQVPYQQQQRIVRMFDLWFCRVDKAIFDGVETVVLLVGKDDGAVRLVSGGGRRRSVERKQVEFP